VSQLKDEAKLKDGSKDIDVVKMDYWVFIMMLLLLLCSVSLGSMSWHLYYSILEINKQTWPNMIKTFTDVIYN
jgi:hypothetical protein